MAQAFDGLLNLFGGGQDALAGFQAEKIDPLVAEAQRIAQETGISLKEAYDGVVRQAQMNMPNYRLIAPAKEPSTVGEAIGTPEQKRQEQARRERAMRAGMQQREAARQAAMPDALPFSVGGVLDGVSDFFSQTRPSNPADAAVVARRQQKAAGTYEDPNTPEKRRERAAGLSEEQKAALDAADAQVDALDAAEDRRRQAQIQDQANRYADNAYDSMFPPTRTGPQPPLEAAQNVRPPIDNQTRLREVTVPDRQYRDGFGGTLDQNPRTAPLDEEGKRLQGLLESMGAFDLTGRAGGENESIAAQDPGMLSRFGRGVLDYLSDPVNRKNLAIGFNAMTLNPDRGFQQAMLSQIERIEDDRAAQRQGNRTAAFLKTMGLPDETIAAAQGSPELMNALATQAIKASGDSTATEAFKTKHQSLVAAGVVPGSPKYQRLMVAQYETELDKLAYNAEILNLRPGSSEFQNYIASGGKSLATATPEDTGTVPQGYIRATNEAGELVLMPLPGSEAYQAEGKKIARSVNQYQAAGDFVTTLNSAKDLLKEGGDDFFDTSSGALGAIASDFLKAPVLRAAFTSSNRANLEGYIQTLAANIGFDRLQRMREESPTGGALGQVAVRELLDLQATLGSLNLNQSADVVIKNLEMIERKYLENMAQLYAGFSEKTLSKYGITPIEYENAGKYASTTGGSDILSQADAIIGSSN